MSDQSTSDGGNEVDVQEIPEIQFDKFYVLYILHITQ